MRRALRRVRELVGDNPAFLPLVLALTPEGRRRRVTATTDVVIEGYPRSGNTFAVWAFRLAQPRPVTLASHAHVPAQVKRAVALGIPTLVVVRPPLDAAASLLVAAPHLRPAAALREYAHHHRELVPFASGFLVATFDEVTRDFGEVIRRLNRRFDTRFEPFVPSAEHTAAVFDAIDRYHAPLTGGRVSVGRVPRPSPDRAAALQDARRALLDPALGPRLERAEQAFATFLQLRSAES